LLVAFVAGCAPTSDNQLQVQTNPAPETQNFGSKTDELMATGGDMVLNQAAVPYLA
jgi:hypothetical protein